MLDGSEMAVPKVVKTTIRAVVYLFVVFTISILFFEFLLRVLSYRPSMKMYDYTILFDEAILFKIKPNCIPEINSMGYRGSEFDHKKGRTRRILFLGDSFVMGHNVPPGQTIAAGLGRALDSGFEVFNMGVLAYGPDQSLVALLEDGLLLKPDMVVLGIFAANDFQDIERNELFLIDGGGRLIRNPENVINKNIPKSRAQFLFNRFQYIVQPKVDPNHRVLSRKHEYMIHHLIADFYDWELLYDAESESSVAKIEMMREILSSFKNKLRSQDVEFAVVIIPSYPNIVDVSEFSNIGMEEEYFEEFLRDRGRFLGPENIVVNLCDGLGIPYLNLYPEFLAFDEGERGEFYDPVDWHLSAYGNQFSGDLVASELVRPRVSPSDWEINRPWLSPKPQRPWM